MLMKRIGLTIVDVGVLDHFLKHEVYFSGLLEAVNAHDFPDEGDPSSQKPQSGLSIARGDSEIEGNLRWIFLIICSLLVRISLLNDLLLITDYPR